MVAEQRFVTIEYFIKDMMGFRSKTSYYNHIKDKGWPQPVYPADGQPLLVYAECVAYQKMLMAARDKEQPPKAETPPPKRRRIGRPAKAVV